MLVRKSYGEKRKHRKRIYELKTLDKELDDDMKRGDEEKAQYVNFQLDFQLEIFYISQFIITLIF